MPVLRDKDFREGNALPQLHFVTAGFVRDARGETRAGELLPRQFFWRVFRMHALAFDVVDVLPQTLRH